MTQYKWFGTPSWQGPLPWLLAIAAILLAREAGPFLLPVTIALLLAFLLSGPVAFLQRRGIPEFIGALLVLVLIGWGVFMLGSALVKPAAAWWADAPQNVGRLLSALERLRDSVPLFKLLSPADAAADASLQQRIVTEMLAMAQSAAVHVGSFGFALISTTFLLYFMLVSQRRLLPHLVATLPTRRERVHVVRALRDVQGDIGRYLGVMVFMNAMLGLSTAIVFRLLGLAEPAFWGVLAATLNFIPYLGPATMYVLLLLAGVWQFDTPGMMVAPVLGYGVASVLESSMIAPWLVGQRMHIHRLLVFLSVIFWAWMWGVGGTVVAVPVFIGLRAALRRRRHLPLWRALFDPDNDSTPEVAALLRAPSAVKRNAGAALHASVKMKRDPPRLKDGSRR